MASPADTLSGVAIKTLLLTDLVDSTALSERLGDHRMAEVSAAHDRLARDLLADYAGLEIDKSDGFLMIFERPIDAVGYALAYHRQVAELSAELGVEIAARAGLNLGELYLRRNPPEDVARGAKPLEVEGIAKPVTARVTSLAAARQTLLTRSVFDLTRQAVATDERLRNQPLRWMAHGGYLFQGVSEPVEVFEVGLEGFSPLTAPTDSAKARRAAEDPLTLGWRPAAGAPLPMRQHWVLQEKLGEGGFGEVWLARHEKINERRAFKFCFEAERLRALQREVTFFRLMKEALGSRDDIVRIFDWNFDEPPFYVELDYTEGGDFVAWAREQGGLGAVPLATRLELVAQTAQALSAAHSVGILHKDVKPSNVLITTDKNGAPRAQLTDFGVGLLTDRSLFAASGITALGLTSDEPFASSGTQLYMAPELLEGKMPSVQADVYALGVLLYQVVVGDFSRAVAQGWRRDVEDEILREDLAALIDGSPERRPGDAAEVAERLRRLDERRAERAARERERREAEEARQALARGRRRRRLLLAAVTVLALFSAAMAFQVRRTRQEAARANREAATVRQVSEFLEGLFEVVDPGEARGSTVTAREILDRGARRIDEELADEPLVQARLMNVMGGVFRNLGLYETARPLSERALETRRALHGEEHPEVAESLNDLGRLLGVAGEHEAAEPFLRDALAMRRKLLGDDHVDVAETACNLGDLLLERARLDDARELFQECLAIRRRHLGDPHDRIADALWSLATVEHFRGGPAEELYQQALAMYEGLHPGPYPAIGELLNNYAYLKKDRGDYAGAEPLFRRSLEVKDQLLGPEHPFTGIGRSNLAIVLNAEGKHVEAEALARQAVEVFQESFGGEHWQTAIAQSVLGAGLAGQGRYEEAEPLLVQSYRLIQDQRRAELNYADDARARLVALYEAWGQPERAAAYRAELDEPAGR